VPDGDIEADEEGTRMVRYLPLRGATPDRERLRPAVDERMNADAAKHCRWLP
jgi:hypothetical protein